MKYAFVLGRHPALSVAELVRAVPSLSLESVTGAVAVGSCPELAPGFIGLLGGTIKIAAIDAEYRTLEPISAETLHKLLPAREGRIIFGLSLYGNLTPEERRRLYLQGLELKKEIKAEGRRARYVVSKEPQLSSVVVAKNKLIEEGAEFVVIKSKKGAALARTLAVQEFEAYGERDFDRPGRSARRGMLPPKLCQMMINIASGDKARTLLDPFCGSGTVLGEALLMGYSQVIGTDLDESAVNDTKAYLGWLEKKHQEIAGRWRVFASDARLLDKTISAESVGTIVTEPFLGPPQSGKEEQAHLKKILDDTLVPLYRESIAALSGLLMPGANAVFSFPILNRHRSPIFVPLEKVRGALTPVPLVPSEYSEFDLPLSASGGGLYDRPDQFVGREIVVLRKT